jgi:hypothetical protein
MWDYVDDVTRGDPRHRRVVPEVVAERGLLVEVSAGSFVGRVTRVTAREVELTDRRGRARRFELHPAAFLVDDRPVTLVPPPRGDTPAAPAAPRVTASGSLAVEDSAPRVAKASRILVEGVHDAELLERIWGDDLRYEGIVVETLDGIDDLADVVRAFGPAPHRRLGVLVDHLVAGSKEQRIAAQVRHPDVLVTGHPFVDVWAAVKPEVLGIAGWPDVPMGEDWKTGTARRLGYADPQDLWRHIRTTVSAYTDLDRRMVGAVERLIDFVTVPGAD